MEHDFPQKIGRRHPISDILGRRALMMEVNRSLDGVEMAWELKDQKPEDVRPRRKEQKGFRIEVFGRTVPAIFRVAAI